MPFSPELAEIRFGCGLSPAISSPSEPLALLEGLSGPDDMGVKFPLKGFEPLRARLAEVARLRKKYRNATDKTELNKQTRKLRQQSTREGGFHYMQTLQRWTHTGTGFRERLALFWFDHFTAKGKNPLLKYAGAIYADQAIRPNISGSFADLLIASTTHPLMLHFLDQDRSIGPTSKAATKSRRLKGLNENLAREVMELHTLGVDGPYTQDDVRQLAELFTGLGITRDLGFVFRAGNTEPGPETFMGQSYGDDPATVEPILLALRNLATHPATARHIARKLAVHFVSDNPDPALVDHIEARFNDTGGDLLAVSAALLEHPSAWVATLDNVKPPGDFIASACRALTPTARQFDSLAPRHVRALMLKPLELMGQPWLRPNGPDGWAEEDGAWVTPQGVSARLLWALNVPQRLRRVLPEPDDFVTNALGPYATPPVQFAARSAESRADAIGLVLASPAFQRR